jgi:hypothetical protein
MARNIPSPEDQVQPTDLIGRTLRRFDISPDEPNCRQILEEMLLEASCDVRLDSCTYWESPAGPRLKGTCGNVEFTIPVPSKPKPGEVVQVPPNNRRYFIGSFAQEDK